MDQERREEWQLVGGHLLLGFMLIAQSAFNVLRIKVMERIRR